MAPRRSTSLTSPTTDDDQKEPQRRSSKDHLLVLTSSLRSSSQQKQPIKRSSIRSVSSNDDSNSSTCSAPPPSTEKQKRRSSSLLNSIFKSSNNPSIHKLVEHKEWDALLERLETPVGQAQVTNVDFTGYTVLYDVCEKNPPLEVVRRVLKAFPEAIKIKDLFSRLPLHVACAKGADLEIIRLLVKVFPGGVLHKDHTGRLALHYAVEYACKIVAGEEDEECSSSGGGITDVASLYGTIQTLTNVKASVIHMKDKKGEDAAALARRLGGGSAFSKNIMKHFQEVDSKDSEKWANSDDDEDNDDDSDDSEYEGY